MKHQNAGLAPATGMTRRSMVLGYLRGASLGAARRWSQLVSEVHSGNNRGVACKVLP